jgi:hypothetical protein
MRKKSFLILPSHHPGKYTDNCWHALVTIFIKRLDVQLPGSVKMSRFYKHEGRVTKKPKGNEEILKR